MTPSADYDAAYLAAAGAAHSAAEAHDFARDARQAAGAIPVPQRETTAGIAAQQRASEACAAAVRASKLAAEAAAAATGGDAEYAADRQIVIADLRASAQNLADAAKRSAQEASR